MLLPLRIRTHVSFELENSMLFILDIIISFTQITGRGGGGAPCCGLKAKGVDTQSETGNTVNDILWEV